MEVGIKYMIATSRTIIKYDSIRERDTAVKKLQKDGVFFQLYMIETRAG